MRTGRSRRTAGRSSASTAIQRPTGTRRRRRRASPSTAAISGGSSSVTTSSRSAHSGIVLRCSSRPVCIAEEMSGAVSSASTALSTARPKPSRRSALTGSCGDGPAFAGDLDEHGGQAAGVRARPVRRRRGGRRGARAGRARSARRGRCRPASVIASATRALQLQGSGAEAVGEGHDERRARVIAREVAEHDRRVERSGAGRAPIGRPRAAPPPRRRRCLRSSTRGRSCAWSRARRTRARAPAAPRSPTVRPATRARRRRGARGSRSAWRWSSPGAARPRS